MGLSNVTVETTEQRSEFDALHLPVSFVEPHWYAAYTCANHEKRVAAELGLSLNAALLAKSRVLKRLRRDLAEFVD